MNKAIASQGRMIELLKERRSAIITQAVTKGLDPEAKMKDSGVTWLGQVPAHWEIKRLRFLLSNKSPKSEYIKGDYVGLENIESATGAYSPAEDFIPSGVVSHFSSGDILFGKLRPYLQKVALAIRGGFCSTEILPLTPCNAENRQYLQRLLSCWGFIDYVNSASYGSKMPRVDWSMLADVPLPCPPVGEAIMIAEQLYVQLEAMDNAIKTQEHMIVLLKERRSAIITQAVTGQIDVR
jgi:restriction endonuclease S subunit